MDLDSLIEDYGKILDGFLEDPMLFYILYTEPNDDYIPFEEDDEE